MQKLKNMLQASNEKKRADEDYLYATTQRDVMYVDLARLETDRQAKILQLGQFEEQEREQQRKEQYKIREDRFTFKINEFLAPLASEWDNHFQYYLLLVKIKAKVLRLDVPENHEFHQQIKENLNIINSKTIETMQLILAGYDVNYDYHTYFQNLLNIKNTLHGMRFDTPDDLLERIQYLRSQKAWDDTYEVYRANQRLSFKNYFMGVPKNEGRVVSYVFSWLVYTVFLGFILIPLKNTLKLLTEFSPRRLDAYCQNKIEQAEQNNSTNAFATFGRYFFRLLYLLLRPITSPIKAFCGCCISESSTPSPVFPPAKVGAAPINSSSAIVSRKLSTTTANHSVATVLIQAEKPIEETKPLNKDKASLTIAEDRLAMVSPKLF